LVWLGAPPLLQDELTAGAGLFLPLLLLLPLWVTIQQQVLLAQQLLMVWL
jgi:hypothetical protein